jgi:hypothetical protein
MVILCGSITGAVRLSDSYREFRRPYRHLTGLAQRGRTLNYVEIVPHNLPNDHTEQINRISSQAYLYGNFSAS